MRVVVVDIRFPRGVEPLLGLAVQLQALGAEAVLCVPPDEEFAQRAAGLGVPLVPFGKSVRAMELRGDEVVRGRDKPTSARFDRRPVRHRRQRGQDVMRCSRPAWYGPPPAPARSPITWASTTFYASYHPSHLPSPHHQPRSMRAADSDRARTTTG